MESFEKRISAHLKPIAKKLPNGIDLTTSAADKILLGKKDDQWNLLFTRRTNGVKTHQGEVSFPGGAWEEGDLTMADTALRETREEIGVAEERITLLGEMDPHLTIYGFTVFPLVGIIESLQDFETNTEEVERVFFIPLAWLLDSDNVYTMDHELFGKKVTRVLHYKDFDGEHLWGLTARITQDLLMRI